MAKGNEVKEFFDNKDGRFEQTINEAKENNMFVFLTGGRVASIASSDEQLAMLSCFIRMLHEDNNIPKELIDKAVYLAFLSEEETKKLAMEKAKELLEFFKNNID